jgi:hypothetical protein
VQDQEDKKYQEVQEEERKIGGDGGQEETISAKSRKTSGA